MATNVTSPEAEEDVFVGEGFALHVRVVFVLIGCVYMIVGAFGNIFIITTILVTKTMRNPHFYFIINLAVSDLIITGYQIPNFIVSLVLGYYPAINFNHCIFNGFITVCAYVSSLLSLMAISVNRYLCICHNQMFSRLFSNKVLSSTVGCSSIWLIAVLSTMPCLLGWGRFTYDTKVHYCCYDRTYSFSYTLFLLTFSIGVPVIVVFACNFAMWRYVRRSSHRIYAMTHSGHKDQKGDNQKTTLSSNNSNGGGDDDSVSKSDDKAVGDYNDTGVETDKSRTQTSTTVVASNPGKLKHKQKVRRDAKKSLEPDKSSGVLVTPGELALIKTIFTIFVSFAVLMTPYMLSTLLDREDRWPSEVHLFCSFTSFSNCCLNCVLYGLMTPAFKKAYRNLFARCCTFLAEGD